MSVLPAFTLDQETLRRWYSEGRMWGELGPIFRVDEDAVYGIVRQGAGESSGYSEEFPVVGRFAFSPTKIEVRLGYATLGYLGFSGKIRVGVSLFRDGRLLSDGEGRTVWYIEEEGFSKGVATFVVEGTRLRVFRDEEPVLEAALGDLPKSAKVYVSVQSTSGAGGGGVYFVRASYEDAYALLGEVLMQVIPLLIVISIVILMIDLVT